MARSCFAASPSTFRDSMNARPAELPRRVAATLCTLALATELGATSAPPARAAGGPAVTVPVLMYHRIDAKVPADAVGRDFTVEPRAFEAQVRYLHEHRIATLTAADLAARVARGERVGHAVVLTFDDGYEDAATVATPILARYGERGTFFVGDRSVMPTPPASTTSRPSACSATRG